MLIGPALTGFRAIAHLAPEGFVAGKEWDVTDLASFVWVHVSSA